MIKAARPGDLGSFDQLRRPYQDLLFSIAMWISGDEDFEES